VDDLADVKIVKLKPEEVRRLLQQDTEDYLARRPWESWEDDILHEFYGRVPMAQIGKRLGKSASQVAHRLEKLGLMGSVTSRPYPKDRTDRHK
jgi:transcriptional regulator of aromatic amino acid metabolism